MKASTTLRVVHCQASRRLRFRTISLTEQCIASVRDQEGPSLLQAVTVSIYCRASGLYTLGHEVTCTLLTVITGLSVDQSDHSVWATVLPTLLHCARHRLSLGPFQLVPRPWVVTL